MHELMASLYPNPNLNLTLALPLTLTLPRMHELMASPASRCTTMRSRPHLAAR